MGRVFPCKNVRRSCRRPRLLDVGVPGSGGAREWGCQGVGEGVPGSGVARECGVPGGWGVPRSRGCQEVGDARK